MKHISALSLTSDARNVVTPSSHEPTWDKVVAWGVGCTHAQIILRSSVGYYKCSLESGTWFSLQYLDRSEAGRKNIWRRWGTKRKRRRIKPQTESLWKKKLDFWALALLSSVSVWQLKRCVHEVLLSLREKFTGKRVWTAGWRNSSWSVAGVQLFHCCKSYSIMAHTRSAAQTGVKLGSGPGLL